MKIDGTGRKLQKTNGKRPKSNEDRRKGSETPENQQKTTNIQRSATEQIGNCGKQTENKRNPVKIDGTDLTSPKTNGQKSKSSEDKRNRS